MSFAIAYLYLNLQPVKLGPAAVEGGVIPQSAGRKQFGKFVKIIGDMFRGMGIGTDGENLAAQFRISFDEILVGVGVPEAVFITAGIAFNSLPFGN